MYIDRRLNDLYDRVGLLLDDELHKCMVSCVMMMMMMMMLLLMMMMVMMIPITVTPEGITIDVSATQY